ncbi:hypothetical protein BC827DRAFT_464995 [Russula dissimulans]|nr:hypothetical protein BC827DRAFT_464995 [Russula dissimulans]
MPHTLLVSFSLLALVVTARPIVPISGYSQPAEVQNAIKTIFEERTKQSKTEPFGFAQGQVDIRVISDEGQQAVLSQLDGSAIKALVPLEGTESEVPPEVQKLREMLGGSKHIDDIESTFSSELTNANDVELSTNAVEERPSPSGLTSAPLLTESARVLTGLSLTTLLAVYTFIALATGLYAFYLIRGFLVNQGEEEEKQRLCPGDMDSVYADEKGTTTPEKASASDLDAVLDTVSPQSSHPPTGMLVEINEDVILSDGEVDSSSTSSELRPVIEKPWLVPLPPSPTSSPLWRTVQLDEVAPVEGNSRPAWAMVVSDEQHRPDDDRLWSSCRCSVVDAFCDGYIWLGRSTCRWWRGRRGRRKTTKACRVVMCAFSQGFAS